MLIDWAVQPMGVIFLLMLLTMVTWVVAGCRPILPFLVFAFTICLFWAASMPSIANALVLQLENERSNPEYCNLQSMMPTVVPGGGMDFYVASTDPWEILDTNSILRARGAVAYNEHTTHYYLLGGGDNNRSVAAAMSRLMQQHNIEPVRIAVDEASKSTEQNAIALQSMLPADNNPAIRLVTSALHVARAAATFEAAGYRVCHVAVDTLYSVPEPPVSLLPYLSGLAKTTSVMHETIAKLLYRLKGIT